LFQYSPPPKKHHPRPVYLVVDATYFGERTENSSWCVLVARDPKKQEDLVWGFADTETVLGYRKLREELEYYGYSIKSVTGDGFSGIFTAFSGIPYQMCQVHMERLVEHRTTKNPQTEAGQVLLALAKSLHTTNSHLFYTRFTKFVEYYRDFLNEKSLHPITGEWDWTHRPLRQAVLSIDRLKKYLFIFEHNKNILKNTNSLEGHFSHVKRFLGIHRGVPRKHAQNILHTILLASSVSPDEEKLDQIL